MPSCLNETSTTVDFVKTVADIFDGKLESTRTDNKSKVLAKNESVNLDFLATNNEAARYVHFFNISLCVPNMSV